MTRVFSRPSSKTVLLASALLATGCAGGGGSEASSAPAAPAPAAPAATERPATLAAGVFTAEQATAGGQVFNSVCAECHAEREFRGTDFFFLWEGSNVGRFLEVVSETMPEDNPGGLTEDQYLAVTAYVLQMNEYPAGSVPLADDAEYLSSLTFERGEDASESDGR
ncbi:hypothetical protein WI372_11790 [Gemmatimonadota bacterium DH-20]|uniref:Cytochrome c domain-containing protein n=1 Tax=Gaopeijia maritima TaxID=3119007 RepID=A0ABU9EAA6_9BACT